MVSKLNCTSSIHYNLDTIPSSPLQRAIELRLALCKPLKILLEESSSLAEHDFVNSLDSDPTCYARYLKIDQLGALYGTTSLLRIWEGVMSNDKLPYSVAHSFNIWSEKCHPSDMQFGRPVLTWQSCRFEKYISWHNSIFCQPVIHIPSPLRIISSLRSEYNSQCILADSSDGDKCLFFLSHSTNHIESCFDIEEIEEIVSSLRKKYDVVNCVLYFLDTHRRNIVTGLFDNIFCCGHNLDPCFLLRLYALIEMHDTVAYNKIGSHAFMASSIYKPVLHFDSTVTLKAKDLELKYDGFSNPFFEKYASVLSSYAGKDVSSLLLLNTSYLYDEPSCFSSLRGIRRNKLFRFYLIIASFFVPKISAVKNSFVRFLRLFVALSGRLFD